MWREKKNTEMCLGVLLDDRSFSRRYNKSTAYSVSRFFADCNKKSVSRKVKKKQTISENVMNIDVTVNLNEKGDLL